MSLTQNLTQGSARVQIDPSDVNALRAAGVLIDDARRERPRYFDGRFLAARDLIRDQQYFLTREADLGQAAGSGVAAGLFVTQGSAPQTLTVGAGHGATPAGELVLLPRDVSVQLADIPVAEQLSASFGLSRVPQPPLRSRTGLFVLALRPVEFTANPIGAYPTSITGQRTVEDGDVIEATAVVLVPWNDDGATDALQARRGSAARAIFVQSVAQGVSANVLPLAMLALQNNTVVWIDEAMVRRELGADRGDLPGLGFAPRGLRLAHLMQHQTHLSDVVQLMGGRAFPAATQFPALPPAGPLPPNVINPADFTQNYFPATMTVDFTLIPEDELPALVEEALSLPPIDFSATDDVLDSTAVVIVAPVPRNQWAAVMAKLNTNTRILKPAAPNLIAQRKPLEILQRLRIPNVDQPAPDPTNPSDAQWQSLATLNTLWFVRRRNLAYRDDLAGTPVQLAGPNEAVIENDVRQRITQLGLSSQLDSVLSNATPLATSQVISLLSAPRFTSSPALTAAALGALKASVVQPAGDATTSALDKATVLGVAAQLNAPGVGDGLVKVEQASANQTLSTNALQKLAQGNDALVLDQTIRTASPTEVSKLAAGIITLPKAAVVKTVATPAMATTGTLSPKASSDLHAKALKSTAAKGAATKPATKPATKKPAAAKTGTAKAKTAAHAKKK
ncbi:MAG TPA: hypothetical protein VFW00_10480 [Rhodocyclaceae bacterium]|nr:hypothetical protein [Rhodocyclaceae bacterium]